MEGWEGRKAKKRRIEGVQEKKKNQGLAGIEKPAESKFEAKKGNSLNPSKNSYLTIFPF